MKLLFSKKRMYVGIAFLVIILVLVMIRQVSQRDNTEVVMATVESGSVRQLVSVSGIAEAKQTAELAFPVSGTVLEVLVEEGDTVAVGDVLVTLDARTLYADRQDALAALARAVADRDELLTGPTASAREVTAETLASKQATLITTRDTEGQKVANAYRALLSSNLSAYSNDPTEDATPPIISGTYTCDSEGAYTLTIFNSKSDSGYSYKLSGLETGTYVVSTEQPTPLGTCGLRAQFGGSSIYNNSVWHIDIPNTKSPNYVASRNAYTLAVTQADTAIELAEQAVLLAEADAQNQNAPARSEAITRANAAITQAQARLARIDATIADRTLTAPFGGVVTTLDILPGETVTTAPVVTLLASNEFKVIARIPEIDIGKLAVGQAAEMIFDARTTETIWGDISFISPIATEIDGVAYYEATIQFRTLPNWIRSGLNADIEVIIAEATDALRVPKRFVNKNDTGYEVLVYRDNNLASTSVDIILEGNDGYFAITGITAGDIVVAP
ncbi:HlyD family efflux transporter periplasmic adaptor subunit [Candidatus Kaiserbacteria bacterium]|nr:HlyD family efflux transporter periplasmic adaptor subunit [Candidatus Kaiserbacteria bacterium]MCB9812191.1 HlyD family efflux transporter periplasmic adaptor subunit [Candidatus Nomurabacteria bacterium]